MGEHRRGLTTALAVAAGMLATGGGLAIASKSAKPIPIGADGTITACAKQGDGRLRLVAKAQSCDRHEQVVTWNQRGQAGSDAAPGDIVVGTLALGAAAPVSIHAFSFGAGNETIVSGGGGAGSGKVKVADVEILKDLDGLTIDSTEGVFTGKRFTTLKVVLFNPGAVTPRATYSFEDVLFSGTQQFSVGALERLTFTYRKVALVIGARTFRFDVGQNKKL